MRLRRFRRMVRLADRVVAGNDFLAEQAARFTSKTKIDVVPSCIPVEDTPARHHRSADDLTLVWIGSSRE